MLHPALLLPLPACTDENIGDWIDTDFGAVKYQEVGGASVVYADQDGALTFAHILDDGRVVSAPHGLSLRNKNVAALHADTDLYAVISTPTHRVIGETPAHA